MFRIMITHCNKSLSVGMAIPTQLKSTKEARAKELARQVAESLPHNMCAEVWPDKAFNIGEYVVYQVVGKLPLH